MENEDYVKTNREQAISPKAHTKHWCDYCDRSEVSNGEKCNSCGVRAQGNKLKKDT